MTELLTAEIVRLSEENARLRAELKPYLDGDYTLGSMYDGVCAERDELQRRVDALWEAFDVYGDHRDSCPSQLATGPCNCGFSAAYNAALGDSEP